MLNDQTSKILGNRKPAALLSVEFKLWEALLAVATGSKTGMTAMRDFFDSDVPWNELDSLSQVEKDFFCIGKRYSIYYDMKLPKVIIRSKPPCQQGLQDPYG